MSEDKTELKKELARRKRLASDVASQIHDIVEDTLWTNYTMLPVLSAQIVELVNDAHAFKEANGL